ncbi:hypothetical protein SDC9_125655 [bioreactor metagenome]|uniref:Solute-binding protein family 5 domain-containing protein n=1 Tax=bioreactor metagenome TaxID=1076179 RepID=A0A645CP38_9ZZZZ
MCTVTNVPYYLDAGEFYNSFYAPASQGTSNNVTWLNEDGFQERIDKALSIVDQTERYAAYADLESYILNDLCPAIYWVDLFESVAYHSDYVYWPAAEYYKEHGVPANTALGYHYIFREFEIHNDKMGN